jgi:hypothetical protein
VFSVSKPQEVFSTGYQLHPFTIHLLSGEMENIFNLGQNLVSRGVERLLELDPDTPSPEKRTVSETPSTETTAVEAVHAGVTAEDHQGDQDQAKEDTDQATHLSQPTLAAPESSGAG